jgi:tetratricopeptide (TPR) repeat protein
VIAKTYPGHAPTSVVPVGYEIQGDADESLFVEEYGIKDFILCVGRLESRKNQLMLQLALENSTLPVVFASGGFTYQPEYANAVRNFKRAGKTLVLERLSSDMLLSAYAAARVHALPSWYELPGLVSLEAAHKGCNIVAADTGTTRDYLGEGAFYCKPGDVDSIRNAVLAAYYSPVCHDLSEHVRAFTWEEATRKTIHVYEQVLRRTLLSEATSLSTDVEPSRNNIMAPNAQFGRSEGSKTSVTKISLEEFEKLSQAGFEAARERNFREAHELLESAEKLNPQALRVLCNRAAVFLAEEKVEQAKYYFSRAAAIDPLDVKAQSGIGMCCMMEGDKETAYNHFLDVLTREPTDMLAILQFIDCSYSLERYCDLERILRLTVSSVPDNCEMRYCLAGCLFRQAKYDEAMRETEVLLAAAPYNEGYEKLKQMIEESTQLVTSTSGMITRSSGVDSHTNSNFQMDPVVTATSICRESSSIVNAGAGQVSSGSISLKSQIIEEVDEKPASRAFDSIDVRVSELEELKHRKAYREALEGTSELLERSILSDSQRKSSELLHAELLAVTGEREQAKTIFERYHALDETCPRALCGIAAIAASYNELLTADQLFHRALSSDPRCDTAMTGLGLCAYFTENKDSAWRWYSKALDENPENLNALYGIMQLSYERGELSTLEARLEGYLELHPADLDMVYSYAGCLYAQKRIDEALSEVQKILIFAPQHEKALELRDLIVGSDKTSIAEITS